MRCNCPYCFQLVSKERNSEGLQYCLACRRFFLVPARRVPPWVWGVLVVLAGNCYIVCHS